MTVPFFSRLKTIIESEETATAADEARDKFPRFEDAWQAFHWLLARRAGTLGLAPSVGHDGLRLYVQEGDHLAGTPSIWSLFKIGDEVVEIVAVRFSEVAYDEEAE
ncbi:hypothetical protein [Novosphingobium colocasiae]|uniref:Uncharacterized protein n=1 Tax=Novosphingobium colocasiae TaxID=1256513 RepID=A0A918UE31_9SPHN|nr:hypothetical protein [Novosphingobium colocasiae]GGY95619.1 hypothetical protein GCM10011614_07920 [Novosphingobium colocasiae]